MTGIIYKGIGGFYYVKTADAGLVECKPRGIFRKQNIKPVPGDAVKLLPEAGTVYISEILPRKNLFVRPPVANVDQLLVVASTTQPTPSFLVLDTLFAVAVDLGVAPVLVITKTDLVPANALQQAYEGSGIPVHCVDTQNSDSLEGVLHALQCKFTVLSGNSGVGKSTLLNALMPELRVTTGEISHKLGRGRHTTREVEIFELGTALVADTPGFASFDLQRASPIPKENLQFVFPEIESLLNQCHFTGCAHLTEQRCAVRQAVQEGRISHSRYNSYVALYEEAKAAEKF